MPFVRVITPETQRLLKRIYHDSRHHQVRQRSHCLILRHQGLKVSQLVNIFQVSRKTLYNWFDAWEARGLVGLYNRPGRGRKPTFTLAQQEQIQQWVQQHPRQLKRVLSNIKEQWDITVSTTTIKRIIKSMHMSWHRFRRVPGDQPDPAEYAQKKAQLEGLKQLDELGLLDLYYLDQAGFCLIPCVPYGWQSIGETLEIPSCNSRRLNVLGIMNRRNDLKSYVWEQSINSDVVISCIDTGFPKPGKRTVIVMDQAPIHTSDAVQDKYQEWKERNIEIFELPRYSPQLNLIEILWRFIKYQWLEVRAYRCWNSFVAHVENVLRDVGDKYVINFG